MSHEFKHSNFGRYNVVLFAYNSKHTWQRIKIKATITESEINELYHLDIIVESDRKLYLQKKGMARIYLPHSSHTNIAISFASIIPLVYLQKKKGRYINNTLNRVHKNFIHVVGSLWVARNHQRPSHADRYLRLSCYTVAAIKCLFVWSFRVFHSIFHNKKIRVGIVNTTSLRISAEAFNF